MKRFVRLITLSCMLLLVVPSFGQDVHFTQYFNSPLTLNPALTASFNGKYRIAANYRNQWWTVTESFGTPTYMTYSASFDAVLFPDQTGEDRFGIGLMFYSDRAGDGALTTMNGMLSIAYHKATDRFGDNQLSLGLQGGVVQKRIDLTKLVFESQLEALGFNPAIYNGESNYDGQPIFYPDVNIGAMWRSTPNDDFAYYMGFSLFHVAKPKESFLQDDENRLDHRYVVHGGMEFSLSDYTKLAPSALFMLQSNAQEWNIGAALKHKSTDELMIYGGAWYRVSDAIIALIGLEYNGFKTGLSYDVNVSDLKTVTRTQGSLELSMMYVFSEQGRYKSYEKFCPDF